MAQASVIQDEATGYQKSLIYNKHLPYYELLATEACKLLEEIKVNLSVAVQKRELWPGVLYWTNRLSRYCT